MTATVRHPDQDVLPRSGTFQRALFMSEVTDATIAARLSIPRPAHEADGLRTMQLALRELAGTLRAAIAEREASRR